MEPSDVSGIRALVTGASSGIGRATAVLLAERGARVLGTGRDEKRLAALQRESPGVRVLAGDLKREAFRERAVAETVGTFGGLDLLVNAAGVIGFGSWEETNLEAWDAMLDVNLRSVYALTRHALPHLVESRGAVVNVSSVTGTRAFPGVLAYCVSKAALDQLTRCLALEVGPKGVRVNAVNPGVVRTNLHRAGGMESASYEAFLERSKGTHPLGRVGEPAEVAAAIAFLGSREAAWITGETLAVDGGRGQTCAR